MSSTGRPAAAVERLRVVRPKIPALETRRQVGGARQNAVALIGPGDGKADAAYLVPGKPVGGKEAVHPLDPPTDNRLGAGLGVGGARRSLVEIVEPSANTPPVFDVVRTTIGADEHFRFGIHGASLAWRVFVAVAKWNCCPAGDSSRGIEAAWRTLAGILHREEGCVILAVFWKRDTLVAFSRRPRDEGVASP